MRLCQLPKSLKQNGEVRRDGQDFYRAAVVQFETISVQNVSAKACLPVYERPNLDTHFRGTSSWYSLRNKLSAFLPARVASATVLK
jgi:hypothetical protein